MADGTKIEWTDATWNIVNGCSRISPGCGGPGPHGGCYAELLAATRLRSHASREGLATMTPNGARWTGEVRFNEAVSNQPLRWKKPRRIFVCAHGDLFHEKVPDEWIDRVFMVMALCPQHQFQVLTKRSKRMLGYLADEETIRRIASRIERYRKTDEARRRGHGPNSIGPLPHGEPGATWWPLTNVWLGVSVEDQQRADE
ncbi:MAG: DUF5131 family protein, partial [Pseudomonadota bacterium]|nr:DUF5131 family protein [Pseudomonadota bacterium]